MEALARRIRTHNYEMRPVLREMFSSAEFYAPAVRRSQIKSPVQYLVQTTKLLAAELPAPPVAQNAMRQMGQLLFAPPNVKGWDGGKSWVSTSTLLFRYNFANYLINGDAMRPAGRGPLMAAVPPRNPIDVAKIVPADLRDKPGELVALLCQRLFGGPGPERERTTFVQFLEKRAPDTTDQTVRELLHLMMSTPQFQLT